MGVLRQRSVEVALGERSYPIRIGAGWLDRAGPEILRATAATRVALVTVPAVGRRYAARLTRGLRQAGVRVHRFDVPDGDRSKSVAQLSKLWDGFLECGLDRSSAVVALGGGMVGDLAGFAAATYLRGISFVQVPTSLLAMVDASVGGKVAVNLRQGKNLAGAFYQPKLVCIDVATLESLPARQRSAGMAEVIKAGALWDRALFAQLEQNIEKALELEPVALVPVIERACEIKAEVVSLDERESGARKLLNLGHTLGHAVEALTGYRKVLHGEAVAMGMVYAAQRSEELDLAPPGTRRRLEELVRRADLPIDLPPFPRRAYLSALRVDKKRKGAKIDYVVLERIGRAKTVPLTPAEIIPRRRAADQNRAGAGAGRPIG